MTELDGLTPSARLVLGILRQSETPLTTRQVIHASGHGRRTIFAALTALRASGLVQSRPSLRDARQTFFWAKPDPRRTLEEVRDARSTA